MLFLAALLAFSGNSLFAQKDADLTGVWQGTLNAAQELRIVIKISKGDDGGLKTVMYSIDQGAQGFAGTTTLQGSAVKISIPGISASFGGKLDADGAIVAGTWTQGTRPSPLNLKRVTADEAWPMPEPAARPKPMAADAPLAFELATIKPSDPGARGRRFGMRSGRQFYTRNTALNDLIGYAYGVHIRQIVGGPPWFESDHYDVLAEPGAEGAPNLAQIKDMLQKLLADRFQLAFHRDKKEIPAYALVVGKNGPKLIKSADQNAGVSLLFRGPGLLPGRNSTMADFARVMQSAVLDRPVLDQTELSGKFDFELKWTPDETQFASLGGAPKPLADDVTGPPDLFTAIQQQLGLQLKSVKAAVDVLVIDRVEKPSAN